MIEPSQARRVVLFQIKKPRPRQTMKTRTVPVPSVKVLVLYTVLAPGLLTAATQPWDRASRHRLKQTLFQEISKRQVLEGKAAIPHSSQPLQQKGVYDCKVRFNFAGECWKKELRHRLAFFDNNPFVPIWVSLLLLEAHVYGRGIEPSNQQLFLSLGYLNTTIDKTRDYDNSLIGFYPYIFDDAQQKFVMRKVFVEEIIHMFENLPPALLDGFRYIIPEPLRQALVIQNKGNNSLGGGCLGDVSDEQIRREIANSGFMVMQYHTVSPVFPSDSDDTFSWLGLGAMLKISRDQRNNFASPLQAWLEMNSNISSAFEALKTYAYRPFSHDSNSNTIDSRSYYALRSFLDQAKAANNDVALVTTWFQNIDEELPAKAGEITMPTFVNDVCLAVGANVLYGIVSTVLSGLVPPEVLDDPDIERLLYNTSSLIDHMIHHDFHERQDLVLFYYPPRNQFFFFLSRSLFLLEMFSRESDLVRPVLSDVHSTIKRCLEENVTDYLVHHARKKEASDTIYFDDFLGDGDITENGDAIRLGEDRIFSTSMAASALMYTWSVFDRSSRSLSWKPDVSETVIDTIEGCIRWLSQHATDPSYKPWNAFFSSGRKGRHNLPFWYPANRFQFINGSRLSSPETQAELPVDMFFAAMQGYVSRVEYEAMLTRPHFGVRTPSSFPGYNAEGWNSFAIWSSEAYTYSAALLAISLFDQLS
ncbi:hypothetical protein ElyMa_005135100 [Elysia marginata]|uniref:Glycosyl hydrolase family 63 C-terminal domain-containing protein n=1 Tax=Elysia marginata TaxID=1093978 RepID=A0AAV4JL62_9GAST|nr:hypothetical protein ElyMa_005135100 [Elysia marginata]